MFLYEDLDSWQKDNRGRYHYRGLLDDELPMHHLRMRAGVLQPIPTGKTNDLGATICKMIDTEITAEIPERMTLREALALLDVAWAENTKAIGAEERTYYIENMSWSQDEDGLPVLNMGLGT